MPQPTVVLSALEFDVAWEAEELPGKHLAVDVPSPGSTHTERSALVADAWRTMDERGLVRRGKLDGDLADRLHALAHYDTAIDVWVWEDRQISGVAVHTRGYAQLAVLDAGEVWLIPARETALAESAVSVAGEVGAGRGRSVRLPYHAMHQAEQVADGDPERIITPLERSGLPLSEAQMLAVMLTDQRRRGQFGVQRRNPSGPPRRADRVVNFHDTGTGRFVSLIRPSTDGVDWMTVTPADNQRLAGCVWELLEEL